MEQKHAKLIKETADEIGLDVEVRDHREPRETTAVVCSFNDFLVCVCEVSAFLARSQIRVPEYAPDPDDLDDIGPLEVEVFIGEMQTVGMERVDLVRSVFY